ncbi:helix-turn-helix domain-containing protein [Terricaulis silvestris]|uniref:Helix-turn-helix domain protein n=1 Tax=Terricaulis silvestris TaxID=2686094 RepID=A0A6I6MK71_9CAUL|nr:helix-turn-helix domain-containing protein [Terricaulis silvestris]QGZ95079.1 Helix-turn-helix domain protein [Terricaulis silvestris]
MLQPVPTDPQAEPDAEARTQRQAQTRPVAPPPELDPAWRAGRKLSEARRQRGWTIEEVADRIRVRKEFLEALEDMNVKLLPGKAYALAFLKSYARELGMDEKAILDQFQDESALTREDANKQIRNPSSKPRRERPWVAAAGLLVIAALFVGWRAYQTNNAPAEEAVASVPAGSSAAPANTSAPAAVRRIVEVRALQEGWLEARGPDGTVFLSRTLQPGDVYRPDASPGWTLHARDGGAFELFVDGAVAGPLGAAGMPVLGRQIDQIQPLTQAELQSPRS